MTSSIPTPLLAGEFDWDTAAQPGSLQTLSILMVLRISWSGRSVYLWEHCLYVPMKWLSHPGTAYPTIPDTGCASKPIDLLWVTLPDLGEYPCPDLISRITRCRHHLRSLTSNGSNVSASLATEASAPTATSLGARETASEPIKPLRQGMQSVGQPIDQAALPDRL